jgi:maltose alpha-D-glucosyltransferase/alpha-amylase
VTTAPTTTTSPRGRSWYHDAIFYEVPVLSFCDGNNDGYGDFVGLASKLDYLQDLGVTCLWLLPFFASPLRDDGYDVSDYRAVHPACGTIDDFKRFLAEAHRRRLRVVAEIPVNHTSDQHPWFQAARQSPADSPLRDYYHWSPTPDRFADAPVLFRDASVSNWSWDAQAKAFYWHRFFSHQPDLNYEQPEVRGEMLRILRFWANLGVDGLSLNGAAFLAERDGSRCEHLPQTHALVQEFRSTLQNEYPDLLLAAGVNAWPTTAQGYFGEGRECQVVPGLALAQRLFLSLRQENRHPLVDLLEQTPEPPEGCQWLTLLRNHDELTLALATDEERDYLFREYASDPATRLHNGILRRLAPLVENSRQRVELLFGLLFALPGAPLIYYGDEIGMGDNPFLSGRSAVRTPMQWSPDRNAGFSTADFARLYAPPVMDVVYGHQGVNVEAQLRDSASQLHWMRRLIGMRKSSAALSSGSLTMVECENSKVMAFVRQDESQPDGETILVVANLARTAQAAELDLSRWQGLIPVEAFGRSPFPRIDDERYVVTLGPHAFLWFRLQKAVKNVATRLAPVATEDVNVLPVIELPSLDGLFDGPARERLERAVLPGFLKSQRWFGGKSRQIESVQLLDWGPLSMPTRAQLALVEIQFADQTRDVYFVPLAIAEDGAALTVYEQHRAQAIARLHLPHGDAVLYDALASNDVCLAMLAAIGNETEVPLRTGAIRFAPTSAFARLRGNVQDQLSAKLGPATSSNSLVFYGRRLLLKLFRRPEPGVNPDYEICRFLTEEQDFRRIPQVAGNLTYLPAGGREPFMLGIVQALVTNQGDGWEHAMDELSRYYDRASARMFGPDPVSPDHRSLVELAQATPPLAAIETIGTYFHPARMLGQRTAEMHQALASATNNNDFTPEPLTAENFEGIRTDILTQAEQSFAALRDNLQRLPPELIADAEHLLNRGREEIERLLSLPHALGASRTRIHGDYHLGQVLWADNDYVILDFEGEPARSVAERRAKFSPVRDVAGMLRSYHYAAYAALFAYVVDRPHDFARLAPWAELWQQWVSAAYLRAYLQTAAGATFLPDDPQAFAALLDSFMLGKALYELSYELNNRPTWVRIPLGGVLSLLEADASAAATMTGD